MNKRNILFILIIVLLSSFIYFFVHDYRPATCTQAETCKICHKTRGKPLEHDFTQVSCTEDSICKRCKTISQKALGHDYLQLTDSFALCKRCGEENGYIETLENPYCDKYLVYNLNLNRLIYSSQSDKPSAPASLTKLLTASVACEYLQEQDTILIGEEIKLVKPASSLAGLKINQELTFKQLLEAMLLPSGNDAAYACATAVGRLINPQSQTTAQAIQTFIEKMNAYAKDLGCQNSNFTSPDGYDDDNQYTTAQDLLLIAKNAYAKPLIKEICAKSHITETLKDGTIFSWNNSNNLLYPQYCADYAYITGLKTGSTPNAQKCIIVTIAKNNLDYLIICLGCKDINDRTEAIKLIIDKLY